MLAVKQPAYQSIATGLQHYEMLHSQQVATVLVWDKLKTEKRWSKVSPNNEKQLELFGEDNLLDRFISVNEFHGWRLISLLAQLRACYVDVDGCSDVSVALQTIQDAMLPPPSAVMRSGRGLHLYWLHEPLPATSLPQWQLVQNALFTALKPLGADPAAKDCTRVLRLAGSVHSKTFATVEGILLDPAPWVFEDLAFEILPEPIPTPKKAKVRDLNAARAERSKKALGRSIYARWYLVLQDLLTIARHHNGIPEGHRNTWLHLCATALSWFANIETIQDELERFARNWTPDISEVELANVLSQPLKRASKVKALQEQGELTPETEQRYKYKRSTLYERLEGLITTELEQQLRAIISEGTFKNREKARQDSRDRVKEGRYQQTRAQFLATSKQAQKPWAALGISRTTYYDRKKKGLL